MATALYRLGRACARHAWRVILVWLGILALVGVGVATLAGPMTNAVTIPDADFQRVSEQLAREIPEAAGGAATVVFHAEDGPFTAEQEQAITEVMAAWGELPGVKAVQDPFAAAQQTADGAAALADAGEQLDAAERQLDKGRTQLDEAQGQLAFARTTLEDWERNDPDNPGLAELRAQVTSGTELLAAQEEKYAAGRADYEAGRAAYDAGVARQEMVNGLRMVSDDGRYAVAQIQFDTNAQSIPPEVRESIPELGEPLAEAGVHVDYSVEITQEDQLIGVGEIVGLLLAGVVLLVMLGTLVAAGLPLAVALIGVGVGLAGAMAASALYEMNSMTPALALMLGLAVGIDYSLFIVNRHRNQVLRGMEPAESIGRANGTAGNAVVFAASTVVIALAALVLSGIPILAQMGLVAAATVAVTVLVAVTLTPALLGLLGRRVAPKRTWRRAGFAVPGDHTSRPPRPGEDEEEHGRWYVTLMTRRPWLTILAVVALVGLVAWPATDLRLGLPDGSAEPAGSTAYRTYESVAENFGPGMNGPLVAVVTLPDGTTAEQAAAKQVEVGTKLSRLYGVEHVVPFGESPDHSTLAYQLVLDTGPADAGTVETVEIISASAPTLGELSGVTVELTGQTVANIEISQRLADALPLYLLVVVGLSLLILMVVFRSVLVPLVATGGFLLTVAGAFGATVAVYQWGWLAPVFDVHRPGAILSFMPIILIGVLFGLAMDYQMFLVAGMREAYAHGADPRSAVRTGFSHGAKVVTAAALIMASVFGGFVFAEMTTVRAIGFGLAVGVLIDAVLVRMTLIPAVMHLLGESAWWLPRWLDRLLPDLDLEGTGLTAHLESQDVIRTVEPSAPSA